MNKPEVERIFKLYYKRLCVFAEYIVQDKMQAEDIVQDTFVKLIYSNNFSEISEEKFKSYLYSAVKNTTLKVLRREKVKRRYFELEPYSEFDDEHVEQLMMKSEIIAEVQKEISKLPKVGQEVIRLAFFEGLKNAEIADLLKITVNTVKTHKRRAFHKLRSGLSKDHFGLFCIYFL